MGAFYAVMIEFKECPVITMIIIVMLWIWVKVFINDYDHYNFYNSYYLTIKKKEYWRIYLSSLCHKSFLHLAINIMALWNCRCIEKFNGSIYFFKYSIVIILIQNIFTYVMINFTIIYIFQNNLILKQFISNLNIYGISSLILSWLTYQSINYINNYNQSTMFLFFGLISFDPSIAPLIMLSIYFIFLSKNFFYSHINSILIGYLLVFNVLTILPDNYWTVCFFIDLILILLLAFLWKHRDNISGDSSDILNQRNINNSHDHNNNHNNNNNDNNNNTNRRMYRRRNINRNILLNNNEYNDDDDINDTNNNNNYYFNLRNNYNFFNQFSSHSNNDNDDNQLEVITYYNDDDNNDVDIESQQSNLQHEHNSIMTSTSNNSSSSSSSHRNKTFVNNNINQSSRISSNYNIDDYNDSDNKSNNNDDSNYKDDDKNDDDGENNDMNSNSAIISGSNSKGRNIVTAVLRGNRKIRLPPYSLSAVYRKEEEAEIEEGLLHSK